MATLTAMLAQTLLVVTAASEAAPMRFGLPLPASAIAGGLGLRGAGVLQWRRLPVGSVDADPVWVEIAIDGARGRVRLLAGGVAATPNGRGPAYALETLERVVAHGRERVSRWRWRSGVVDERVTVEFHAATEVDGESYGIGEAHTRWSPGAEVRGLAATVVPRAVWQRAGVLPPAGRLGARLRRHLRQVRERLVEMPGQRGRGDFSRSGGIVTNLEFDTSLALLRLGLASGDREAVAQGFRAAGHLHDRDLDLLTGLPFAHGRSHRAGRVESGHAWLQGLLLTGLIMADDERIDAARGLGAALAARPPRGKGRFERARCYAWPLLELEALLAVDPDPVLAAAADRLARAIDLRFDASCGTWRFGEGEVGGGVYLERGWITGGLVVPAMRRHLARRSDPEMAARVRQVQAALLENIGSGRAGLPTHWRCAGGRTFAQHRVERDPKALWLLDGLEPPDLRRLLRREEVRDCIAEVPDFDDPDLPTSFSIVARCRWVYR